MPSAPNEVVWFVGLAALSALLTRGALAYARNRQLLDQPGQRRSHAVPTPRGGGIAIVITVVPCVSLLAGQTTGLSAVLTLALLAVAGIGWLDDHRPQPVLRRLMVHLAAALALAWVLPTPSLTYVSSVWLLVALCWIFVVACINAWNFMDGSNGLLASQCLWLGVMLMIVLTVSDPAKSASSWGLLAGATAAACAGFLPFNFPRAAIFMGDVGSGSLGLLCGVLLWVAWALEPNNVWMLMVLPSALLVDASLTLASRITKRRRWYTAHREHLYQWMIRSGHSHARVAVLYMIWNLVVVVPTVTAMRQFPEASAALTGLVLMLASGLWWFGKRALLAGRRTTRRAGRRVPEQGRS